MSSFVVVKMMYSILLESFGKKYLTYRAHFLYSAKLIIL